MIDVEEAAAYANNPTEKNREVLTRVAFPLARKRAWGLWRTKNLPLYIRDQFESDAMLGLVEAINRFDPWVFRSKVFSTNEFAHASWTGHVAQTICLECTESRSERVVEKTIQDSGKL